MHQSALSHTYFIILTHMCHDPSHGGSYVAEGAFCIRIGLSPRIVSGDCLVSIVDWLLTTFIVTVRIQCLVIGVVLVCRLLICLCGPEGYTFDHMYVRFHGSLYPMMDCTLCVWYGLLTPMSADVPWGFFTILLLPATVLGSWYFSDWYDNIGRCGL